MNKLWAFGDSYTFGHELSDCPTNIETIPSQLTYAALVAKNLNYDYRCKALGYYANNAISRTVIENIDNIDKNDLVLVMWTFPIRREFLLDDGLLTISRIDDHEFANYYIKYANLDNCWMINQSLQDIFITQELLKNHRYLFLSAVTDLNKAVINRASFCNSLVNRIDLQNWVILDEMLGFHEWSELVCSKKFSGHPTDRAHSILADRIKEIV